MTEIYDVGDMQKDLGQFEDFRASVRLKLNQAIGILNGPKFEPGFDGEYIPRDIQGEVGEILQGLLEETKN